MSLKRFTAPDERRDFPRGHADLLKFGDDTVGLATFEPGWKWSRDVRPLAGTTSCQAPHSCYMLSGRMHVVMDDGEELEVAAGEFATIPPGHDAWVVGNESCRVLDFTGMEHYAQPNAPAARPDAGRPEARPH